MSFQLFLEGWQGSSIPDGGGKIIPPARNGERELILNLWNKKHCNIIHYTIQKLGVSIIFFLEINTFI